MYKFSNFKQHLTDMSLGAFKIDIIIAGVVEDVAERSIKPFWKSSFSKRSRSVPRI